MISLFTAIASILTIALVVLSSFLLPKETLEEMDHPLR
jgi:hypothetical protein